MVGEYIGGIDWSSGPDVTVTVQPVGRATRVGHVYYAFQGSVDGGPPRPFVMLFPMDRRQARRVSRRTGRRFRMHQGEVIWR